MALLSLALFLVSGSASASELSPVWLGPDGAPLPLESYEEAELFLKTARVLRSKRVGKGINNPLKVLLEKDQIQAHAVFRDVDVNRQLARFRNGKRARNFRDCALFEVAAYRLARLLHLNNLPPTVERSLNGKRGSLQLWVENAVSEKTRAKEKIAPPNVRLWRTQMQHLRFFDNLISNSDRNAGNLLFDGQGLLWMIDHTRAFRRDPELETPTSFYQIERRIWRRLQQADQKVWKQELGRYLNRQEFAGLWERRERIVGRFEELIEQRGEKLVLLDPVDFNPPQLVAAR